MASKAGKADIAGTGGRLKLNLLLRPMPWTQFLALAAVVLVAGAVYCSGYESLLTDRDNWPGSLVWAAYGLLPWLFLFEYIKRREWDADQPVPNGRLALLMVAAGAGSVAAEYAHYELLLGKPAAPLGLQLLRRLPGIAAMVLLIALSRREQEAARRRLGAVKATGADAESLRRHAPAIRWIQAADNYLELHIGGEVWTRRITMREAAEILEPMGFVRVHRSVIVNRDHVDAVVPRSGGPTVRMTDGTALPTGRAFSANLSQLH